MSNLVSSLIAGLLSGTVLSGIIAVLFHRRSTRVEEEIRNQFAIFRSQRQWKADALAHLLAPVYMQLDRTKRAFDRWTSQNLFLEAKVIREGNLAVRDLLLENAHLIPPELLEDAALLIEHYDRWLEEYEKQRLSENPDLDAPFTFVGPAGYPFPRDAERRFRETFTQYWNILYGADYKLSVP